MRITKLGLAKLHRIADGKEQVSELPSQIRWELLEEGLIKDGEITQIGLAVVKGTQKQTLRDTKPEVYQTWDEGKFRELVKDDGTVFSIVDSEGQLLEFRVGPVFFKDHAEHNAIWISYQEYHMDSDLIGPVLISLETFKKLVEYVNSHVPVAQTEEHRKNGAGS